MRRLSPVKLAVAGVSVAALTAGGAYAVNPVAEDADSETAAVVNKNGHEVNEHAADGQARAAEARAAAATRKAAKPAKPVTPAQAEDEADTEESAETEAPAPEQVEVPKEDSGNHGGPNVAAGDHPNASAFLNPQDHDPQGPKPDHTNNAGGLGPDEHAGDHPDEHATSDHKGGKK